MLSNTVVSDNITVGGLVDGVDLAELTKTSVSLNGDDQIINGNVSFENIHIHGNFHLNALMNGKNVSNVVDDTLMTVGDQIITGHHQITNLEVSKDVSASGTINSRKFSEEVVPLDKQTNITATMEFSKLLEADNVDVIEVNDIKLKEFHDRIVYINKDTEISGHVIFTSDLVLEKDLTVGGYINGINITHLVTTTILKAGNQSVDVPTYFEDVVFSQDVVNTNLFNGLNLSYFSNQIVYKCHGENKNITGRITFH